MMSNNPRKITVLALAMLLAACGSKKNLVKDPGSNNPSATTSTVTPGQTSVQGADNATILRNVTSSLPASANLVASIDFTIKRGSKDISVDGKISMRRDEVIRIQLSPMGLVEVGRMEFTRDSVLIMDRIHKQYLKSSYDKVGFLRDNGIDFYALQALFWNQLFVPGEKDLDKSVGKFDIKDNVISLSSGKMKYQWTADTGFEHLMTALATYSSTKHGTSKLDWAYGDFKNFAGKTFPARHTVGITAGTSSGSSKNINVIITLKNMKTDSGWDTITKVPSKYKPVELKDVINQIMKL
jgi:hypothetical protein